MRFGVVRGSGERGIKTISTTTPLTSIHRSMKTDTEAGDTANEVFQVDWDALEATVNSKTRVLVLNSPHNPTGKIFSRTELDRLAGIVSKYPNLIVFSDEVYERIVFDPEGSPHISFATIPGMWERTLTMSSAGKTFSATGWKCGWCVGPEKIIKVRWGVC